MTVLVTGAGGGIGRILVRRLCEEGRGVRVLSRRLEEAGPFPAGTDRIAGDLLDPPSLEGAMDGVDAVIHLAAVTHSHERDLYFQVNVEGTKNLLSAAGNQGLARLVHISSRALGEGGGWYSLSKEMAEEAVRRSSIPWVIFRPAEVYGMDGGDPVAALARTISRWPVVPVIGDGSYTLSPVHVDDVVECIARGLSAPSAIGKTYTLAGPDEVTFNELVDLIASRLGRRRKKVHIPVAAVRSIFLISGLLRRGPVRDQLDRLLLAKSSDSSQASSDLGFRPAALREKLPLPSHSLVARKNLPGR